MWRGLKKGEKKTTGRWGDRMKDGARCRVWVRVRQMRAERCLQSRLRGADDRREEGQWWWGRKMERVEGGQVWSRENEMLRLRLQWRRSRRRRQTGASIHPACFSADVSTHTWDGEIALQSDGNRYPRAHMSRHTNWWGIIAQYTRSLAKINIGLQSLVMDCNPSKCRTAWLYDWDDALNSWAKVKYKSNTSF